MRIAFTIILNGLRHLKHNSFYHSMIQNFDHWIIVEGVASPNGSTEWCKKLDNKFHNNYLSNDGTTEFLDENRHPKVRILRCVNGPWDSKDQQVNAAISEIKRITDSCFLWQVDVDEQWELYDLVKAENALIENKGKTGAFLCDYYVGPGQKVIGAWGEGRHLPYRRLWDWKGESFEKHEPPTLKGKNGPGLLLPQRFKHYAYYFEEDVIFKEAYYQGYEGLHKRWLRVQENRSTMDLNSLLGDNVWWSKTQTFIIYENNDC
jgi:hypothetical protein